MNRPILTLLAWTALLATCPAADYAKWAWSHQLPTEIAASGVRTHRTAQEVDKFFHDGPSHSPSISEIIEFLGPPDGYSRQFIVLQVTRNQGTLQAWWHVPFPPPRRVRASPLDSRF